MQWLVLCFIRCLIIIGALLIIKVGVRMSYFLAIFSAAFLFFGVSNLEACKKCKHHSSFSFGASFESRGHSYSSGHYGRHYRHYGRPVYIHRETTYFSPYEYYEEIHYSRRAPCRPHNYSYMYFNFHR